MRKSFTCILALLTVLGLMVMTGCSDSGGGGGLPQTSGSNAYQGDSDPAYLGTSGSEAEYLAWYDAIGGVAGSIFDNLLFFSPLESDSYTDTITDDGNVGGTYVQTYTEAYSFTTTSSQASITANINLNSFAETFNGGNYCGGCHGDGGPILSGSGGLTWFAETKGTYNGNDLDDRYLDLGFGGPAGVGLQLTGDLRNYNNYADYMESYEDARWQTSGFVDQNMNWVADTTNGIYTWQAPQSGDLTQYATDGEAELILGLLDFDTTAAWDGSETSSVGSGTLCGEGSEGSTIFGPGCFDITFNVVYAGCCPNAWFHWV
jgi:hypothetical protein